MSDVQPFSLPRLSASYPSAESSHPATESSQMAMMARAIDIYTTNLRLQGERDALLKRPSHRPVQRITNILPVHHRRHALHHLAHLSFGDDAVP